MNSMQQEQFHMDSGAQREQGQWLWTTFVTGNSEELAVMLISAMTKLLDMLLTKECVLLFTVVDFLYSETWWSNELTVKKI